MNTKLRKRLISSSLLIISIAGAIGINVKTTFAETSTTSPAVRTYITKGARVFVDKAHPAHGDLSEADFKQLTDAGFTVVVNRWAKDLRGRDIDLNQYVSRAASCGLSVMKWSYGLVDATNDTDRTINRLGKPTRYTIPSSKVGWQQLTDHLLEYARMSLKQHNFRGVLLDYEIYDRPHKTDGFCESYDDQTFRDFFSDMGFDIPDPLPVADQRQQYLIKRQMYQMYIGFQIDQISKEAQALRKAIDKINPNFQIGIYGWGVLVPPIIHQLATPKAPALILDAQTYGRSAYSNAFASGYDADRPDHEALKWSLDTVKKGIAGAHQRYDNVIFLAGHYPQSPGPEDGTQFKFTAKQAFQSAAFGEGYWIWTDWVTPKPWTDRREWYDAMISYFAKANAALDAKNWAWAEKEPETVK